MNDLLQLVPEIAAYADDFTLSDSFKCHDDHLVAAEFSQKLNLIRSGEGNGRSTLPLIRPRQ